MKDIDLNNVDTDKIEDIQGLPLGKRVEHFFDAIIEQSSNYEKVIKNKQIIDNKVTLGEIDSIVFNKKRKIFQHIEIQYKFYLYDDNIKDEISRYVGPSKNDTLLLKLEKLKNKQFPLLFKEETKAYLEGVDFENIEQKILFKANIYLPRHLKNTSLTLINNDCICGYYLSFKDFLEDDSFTNHELFIPHKFDWLIDPELNETWKNYDEAKAEMEFFINKKISPLIWSKRVENGKTIIERFFLTWW